MSTTLPSDKAVHLFRRAEVRWAQRLHHRKRNDKEGKWHIFWFVGFLIVVFLYCCLRVGLLFVKNFGDAIIWMISAVGTTSVDFPRPVCAEYAGQPLGLYFFPWYCSFSIYIQWRCWDTNWIHIYGARHLHPTHRRGHAEIVTRLGMAEDGESTKCCNCTNHVFFNLNLY